MDKKHFLTFYLGKSPINMSYFGLIDARMSASDKEQSVQICEKDATKF